MGARRLKVELPELSRVRKNEVARWQAAKLGGIGGSSAAAAIGIGRYGSRARLWAELTKQEGFTQEKVFEGAQAEKMRWGNLLEREVLKETAARVGGKLIPPSSQARGPDAELVDVFRIKEGGQALLRSRWNPWQHYSLDGLIATDKNGLPKLVEIKTTGQHMEELWDTEPPEEAYIQLHHGFAVTGLKLGLIAALIGGQELRIFEVTRDQDLVDQITLEETNFMRCVEKREMPPIESPVHPDTMAVLKKLYSKDTGETVDLPAEAAALDVMLSSAKAQAKVAKSTIEEIEAKLRAWMGTATFGVIPDAHAAYTLKTTEVEGYEVPARVQEAYSYRQLRRKVL